MNGFKRAILRCLDIMVAFALRRPIRWDKEPYREATIGERRYAGCFLALVPICGLLVAHQHQKFDQWVNSMIYGRHSILWFYLAYIGIVCGLVFILFRFAPRVPLWASVPVAIIGWLVMAARIWSGVL